MNEIDKILNIISMWDHFGQGLFFLLVLIGILGSINYMFKMLVVLARGWPPQDTN